MRRNCLERGREPPLQLRYFSFKVGSPNKMNVRRTSRSLVARLAARMASPIVVGVAPKTRRLNSRPIATCGGVVMRPDEAQTPIAPPLGLRRSASPRLLVKRSWKYPLKQFMATTKGRRGALLRDAAVVDVKRE